MKYKKQVDESHYEFNRYVDEQRWHSYYYQIRRVSDVARKLGKKKITILEIGIGNGIITAILKHLGHKVITMDIDRKLRPDIVKVLPNVPKGRTYDCVVCCEVLEHIKYKDSAISLKRLSIIAKFVVLSIPQKGIHFSYAIKASLLPQLRGIISLPFYHLPHAFDGQHYWELGTSGISERKFRDLLLHSRFNVLFDMRLQANPYHHFYLLQSKRYGK